MEFLYGIIKKSLSKFRDERILVANSYSHLRGFEEKAVLKNSIFFAIYLFCASFVQVSINQRAQAEGKFTVDANVGEIILNIESLVINNSEAYAELQRLINITKENLVNSNTLSVSNERTRAVRVFEVISKTLKDEGYRHRTGIYPNLLSEVLVSRAKNFDCDTGSYLYLSVADELGLPVSMVEVEVPQYSPARAFGDHAFVRWTLEDGSTVDWDPNLEGQRSGDTQTRLYGYAWSKEQVIGYVHFSRALEWEKRDSFRKALADYERSIRLFSEWPKAKNNIAWLISSRRELQVLGREAEALSLAKEVVAVQPTPNNKDTLACAFALNGDFENAISIQREVVAANPNAPSFAENLQKMLNGNNCFVDD